MDMPGRRTDATTNVPGRIVVGTSGPTSTTSPKLSWPVTRKSSPGGAAPYSAALISLSVPSTPTRSTLTLTPRPPGTSVTSGSGISRRWIEFGFPGWTAMAFTAATDSFRPGLLQLTRRSAELLMPGSGGGQARSPRMVSAVPARQNPCRAAHPRDRPALPSSEPVECPGGSDLHHDLHRGALLLA